MRSQHTVRHYWAHGDLLECFMTREELGDGGGGGKEHPRQTIGGVFYHSRKIKKIENLTECLDFSSEWSGES